MLVVDGLKASYGGFLALDGVTLHVEEGETVALLGSNGAGKSTTLRCISRLLPLQKGSIRLDGTDFTNSEPRDLVRAGLIQVPEGRHVFPFLTVRENLELGSFLPAARQHRRETMRAVCDLMPILAQRSKQRAGTLSGGEQQMLAIGRALMARPRLLMLDEPSLGLAPIMVEKIFDLLRDLRSEGMTFLLVEQNATLALDFADRAYVLESGRIALEGSAQALANDPNVQRAYLGLDFVSDDDGSEQMLNEH